MTAAADDAVANLTRAFDNAFPGEDVVYVISGEPLNATRKARLFQ